MYKSMLVIVSMVVSLVTTSTAEAERIVGWDFSQYATAGRLTIDGTTYVNTLGANYTSLGVFNLYNFGNTASALGSMFMNGTVGSTNVSLSSSSQVVPTPRSATLGYSENGYSGSIQGNRADFDALGTLAAAGQANAEFLGLLANSANTIVFQADLTGLGQTGENWSVLFGGETLTGSSTVSVGLDLGCDSGVDVGPTVINLDTTTGSISQTVTFPGLNNSTTACVQFGLAAGAVIDNVSIEATPVPEPGTMLMLSVGVCGVVVLRRIRS